MRRGRGVALAEDSGYRFDPPALVGGAVQRLRCGGRIWRRENRLSLRWPEAARASLSMQNRRLPRATGTFHFEKLPFLFLREEGGVTIILRQNEEKERKTRKKEGDEKHL